jgi:hypothetical protein
MLLSDATGGRAVRFHCPAVGMSVGLPYACKTVPVRMSLNTSTSSEGRCLYVSVCQANSAVHWNRSLRVLFKFLYVFVARVATAFSRHATAVLVNSVTVLLLRKSSHIWSSSVLST